MAFKKRKVALYALFSLFGCPAVIKVYDIVFGIQRYTTTLHCFDSAVGGTATIICSSFAVDIGEGWWKKKKKGHYEGVASDTTSDTRR